MKRGSHGLLLAGLAIALAVGLVIWMLQTHGAGEGTMATAPRAEAPTSEGALPNFSDASAAARPIAVAEPTPAAEEPALAPRAEAPAVATLRVTVLNPERAPLPDATVWLKTAPLKLLRADADGVAAVTGDFGAEVDVAARHPDFRFGVVHATMPARGEPAAEATIVLTAELTACLRVQDERGGAIEGAAVSFQEVRSQDILLRSSAVATPDELTAGLSRELFKGVLDETRLTGPDGRCCVAGITAGPVRIDARAPGYVWASHRKYEIGPRGGDIGVLTLTPARVLHGTVIDAQGPVPDAVVETLHGGRDAGGYMRVVTDADGKFTLDSLMPAVSRMPLLVSHPTRGDFFDEDFTLPRDAATITLRPSFDLTLLPRDASTKAAVAGACTVTRLISFQAFSIRSGQPAKVPIENGAAHVGWFPYYATGLQLAVPGYAGTVVDLAAIEAAGGAPVEVDLVRTGTLAIHVIDGNTGLPVVGAKFGVGCKGPSPGNQVNKASFSSHQVNAAFDEATGAYMLDTSVFTFAPGTDESLGVGGPDGKSTASVPVSANGVRVCGDVLQVTLQPKPK